MILFVQLEKARLIGELLLRKLRDAFTPSLFPSSIYYLKAVLGYANNRVKLMRVLLQFITVLKRILIVALQQIAYA